MRRGDNLPVSGWKWMELYCPLRQVGTRAHVLRASVVIP